MNSGNVSSLSLRAWMLFIYSAEAGTVMTGSYIGSAVSTVRPPSSTAFITLVQSLGWHTNCEIKHGCNYSFRLINVSDDHPHPSNHQQKEEKTEKGFKICQINPRSESSFYNMVKTFWDSNNFIQWAFFSKDRGLPGH